MMVQQILQRAAGEIVPAAMASAFAAYSSLHRCMQPYLCADCGKAHHMSSNEDGGLGSKQQAALSVLHFCKPDMGSIPARV